MCHRHRKRNVETLHGSLYASRAELDSSQLENAKKILNLLAYFTTTNYTLVGETAHSNPDHEQTSRLLFMPT